MRLAIPMLIVPLALAALMVLATVALVRPAAGAHHPPGMTAWGWPTIGPLPITREGM